MSKIHFNNTFSNGCVQFMAADWPATTAHKMIYLLTSYTVAWPVLVLACKLVSTLIGLWFSVLYQVKSCLKERMILALKRGKY